jgi:MFS family permease
MPAFATDVFGPKNAGAIYGAMLTAWSAGAIAGPLLIAAVPYRPALTLIAGMLAVAAVLPIAFTMLVGRDILALMPSPQKRLAGAVMRRETLRRAEARAALSPAVDSAYAVVPEQRRRAA